MGTSRVRGRSTKGYHSMNVGEVAAITFALQAFVTLFVIMDPPGSIPIFLGLVSDKSPATAASLHGKQQQFQWLSLLHLHYLVV